jgi:hypothetical protein
MPQLRPTPSAPGDPRLGPWPAAYQQLRRQLGQTSWICQGTVVCRPLIRRVAGRRVKKGPYYLWTCKVDAQTQCVALSKAQYEAVAQAIENNRKLHRVVARMQAMTLKIVLQKVPGVKKRN